MPSSLTWKKEHCRGAQAQCETGRGLCFDGRCVLTFGGSKD